jgi:hypothetical protein
MASDSALCLLDLGQGYRREQRPATSVGVVVSHLPGPSLELDRTVTAVRHYVVSILLQLWLAITLDDPRDRDGAPGERRLFAVATLILRLSERPWPVSMVRP